MTSLLASSHPRFVDLGTFPLPSGWLDASQHGSTLVSLTQTMYIWMSEPDFTSSWTALRSVRLSCANASTPLPITSFMMVPSLSFLDISSGSFALSMVNQFSSYPALTELRLGDVGSEACGGSPFIIPTTLTTLYIFNLSSTSCSFSPSTNNAVLKNLRLENHDPIGSVGTFTIFGDGLPTSLESLEFGLYMMGMEYLPDLTHLTNLRTLAIPWTKSADIHSDFLSNSLCSKLHFSGIQTLLIYTSDYGYSLQMPAIPCLQDMISLKNVSFDNPTTQHLSQLADASRAQVDPAFGSIPSFASRSHSKVASKTSKTLLSSETFQTSSEASKSSASSSESSESSIFSGITELRINMFNWTYSNVLVPDANMAMSWADLFKCMPNLVVLEMSNGAWGTEFPGEELKSLKQLTKLTLKPIISTLIKKRQHQTRNRVNRPVGKRDITQEDVYQGRINGTLSSDFFLLMPSLRHFDITWQQLAGSIPWYGLERLETLILDRNDFTHWPSLNLTFASVPGYGPPSRLLTLSLSGCLELFQIPDDDSWAGMAPGLRGVDFTFINVSSPFPRALLSASSGVEYIDASSTKWSSTLPDMIAAPNLTYFSVTSTSLCGALPSIFSTGSFSPQDASLHNFEATHTELQGTMPTSYGAYWSIINFSYSPGLNGTLPSSFTFFGAESTSSKLCFPSTSLQGAMFNTSGMGPRDYFDLSTTAIDACTVTLDHAIGCYPPPTACQCSSASWNTFCSAYSTYCQFPPPVPPVNVPTQTCTPVAYVYSVAPPIPAHLTPTNNCPPPRPSPAFQCLANQWTSLQGIAADTVIVAPNGVTHISGDLTTTNGVQYLGTGASLVVDGCTFLGQNRVNIQLSNEDISRISKSGGKLRQPILHYQASNCTGATDLSATQITTTKKYGGCHRASSERSSDSTQGQLVVLFSVDRNLCDLAIALPIVVVIVVIVAVVLAVVICRRQKSKFNQHVDETPRGDKPTPRPS